MTRLVLLLGLFLASGFTPANAVDLRVVAPSSVIYPGDDFALEIQADNIPPEGLGTVQFRLNLTSSGGKIAGVSDLALASSDTVAVAAPLLASGATGRRSGVGDFILQQQGTNGVLMLKNPSLAPPETAVGSGPGVPALSGLYVFSQTHGASPSGGSGVIARFLVHVGGATTAYRLVVGLSDVVLLDGGGDGLANELPVDSIGSATVDFGCRTTVPDVSGMEFAVAQNELLQSALAVGNLYELDHSTGQHPLGKVLEQSVPAGTVLDCRSEIDLAVNIPPQDVTGLSAVDKVGDQDGGVVLHWTPSISQDAAGYLVLKGTAVLADLPDPGASGSEIIGLQNQVNHLLRVVAYDLSGNHSPGAVVAAVPKDDVPPVLSADSLPVATRLSDLAWSGQFEAGTVLRIRNLTTGESLPVSSPLPGRWETTLGGMREGVNHLRVTAVDAAGNESSLQQSIILDTVPPNVTLDVIASPVDHDNLSLSGTVESGATLSVSAPPGVIVGSVSSDVSGRWTCQISALKEGENQIVVSATDAAGNKNVLTPVTIVFQAKPRFDLTISPASIGQFEQVDAALTITLPNPGESVVLTQVLDADGNGQIDLDEPVLRRWQVTDGDSSALLYESRDGDGVADGVISLLLPYQNPFVRLHASGHYLFKVTGAGGESTAGLTIGKETVGQGVTGRVVSNGAPVVGAFVRLSDRWGIPAGYVTTNNLGEYQVPIQSPGDYLLTAESIGLAATASSEATVTVSSGTQVAGPDLELVSGQYLVQGQVYDNATGTGLGGVVLRAEMNGLVSLTRTDASGMFSFALPAGEYHVLPEFNDVLTGLVVLAPANFDVILTQNLTGYDFALAAGSVPVQGRVATSQGQGIPGLRVLAVSPSGDTTSSFTNASGDFSISSIDGAAWTLSADQVLAQAFGYVVSQDDYSSTEFGISQNLTAAPINAWIEGRVDETGLRAVSGARVNFLSVSSGYLLEATTLGDGSYHVGVHEDTWQVDAATEDLGLLPVDMQTITVSSGQVAVVDFLADRLVGPNLQVSNLTPSVTALSTGQTFSNTVVVSNVGSERVEESFRVGLYLSSDGIWDSGDLFIGQYSYIYGLNAGDSSTVAVNASIPNGTVDGSYQVLAYVDYDNRVKDESEENDNVQAAGIGVTYVPPNLQVTSITPSATELTSGQSFSGTVVVSNVGSERVEESFRVGLYLSSDGIWDSGDLFIGQYSYIYGLNAGDSSTVAVNASIPNGTVDGSYQVLAV
ncbi:carboxypeptidase regulatory-like domain-containing protein, partial [Geothermobacter hydrogeniphilus]|uniref:carboxypeptidase regulatory-like domain-containing protein n=1 Tax=Geothermobacter hydrogeniphilus TaxID=1969733 RepID=UPI001304DE3A